MALTQENMSYALGSMQDKSANNENRRQKIQDILVSTLIADSVQNSHAA